jgi:hypothetical protein
MTILLCAVAIPVGYAAGVVHAELLWRITH